jgi:hypothetical protein
MAMNLDHRHVIDSIVVIVAASGSRRWFAFLAEDWPGRSALSGCWPFPASALGDVRSTARDGGIEFQTDDPAPRFERFRWKRC